MEHLTFGEWLRDQRRACGMNQRLFAERVGLTQAQVSRLESGLQKATVDVVRPLIKALNADGAEANYWLERLEPVRPPARKPVLFPARCAAIHHPAQRAARNSSGGAGLSASGR